MKIYSDEELRAMGDVNGDGVIDRTDLNIIARAFGSTPGSPNWNPNCDLNKDGTVDGRDLWTAARNFGAISWKYVYRTVTVSAGSIICGAVMLVGFK